MNERPSRFDADAGRPSAAQLSAGRPNAGGLPAIMLEVWREIMPEMADLPIFNPALDVYSTGFRPLPDYDVGVVVTPWFMNLVAVPRGAIGLPEPGASRALAFPAGEVEFVVGSIRRIGTVLVASLYSPMEAFTAMEVAVQVAGTVLEVLFRPPMTGDDEAPRRLSRRAFVTAGLNRGRLP